MTQPIVTNNLTMTINLIRLINDGLFASELTLSTDVEFNDDTPIAEQQEILMLMRRWLDGILDGCIAWDVHNKLDTSLFGTLSNQLMFCPAEPTDHLLLLLITSKLNAIGAGKVWIANTILSSDEAEGFGLSLTGDPLHMLPSAEEWMGADRYFSEPWWNRSDGSMMDIPMEPGEDPSVKPDILIDMRKDLDKDSAIEGESASGAEMRSAEIIRLNFRPRPRLDD